MKKNYSLNENSIFDESIEKYNQNPILINLRVEERQNVCHVFCIVTKSLFLLAELLRKSNHN